MSSPEKMGGQHDFLDEAARLALQLDPLAWEFALTERSTESELPAHASMLTGQHGFHSRGMSNVQSWARGHEFNNQPALQTAPPYFSSPFDMDHVQSSSCIPSRYQDPSENFVTAARSISEPQILEEQAVPDAEPFRFDPRLISSLQNNFISDAAWHYSDREREWPKVNSVKEEASNTRYAQRTMALEREVAQLKEEKQALESHTKILEDALMKLSTEDKAPPDFIPARGWTSYNPRSKVILEALFDPPKLITAEDAANIPLREYAMLWRKYLSVVKDCLTEIERKDPEKQHAAEDKLKAFLLERHGFLSWVAANNPTICHCLLMMDMDSDPPQKCSAELDAQRRKEVLARMDWTEEQALFLLEARNQFLLSMGYHSAALKHLQQQLSALDPTPLESVRNCHFLNWLSVARSLQDTVEEMHVCSVTFHCQLYKMKRGITPYQSGVLMVESYPNYPDVIALVSDLAASRNAPSASSLFASGEDQYKGNPDTAQIKFVREPHAPVNDRVSQVTQMLQRRESVRERSSLDRARSSGWE